MSATPPPTEGLRLYTDTIGCVAFTVSYRYTRRLAVRYRNQHGTLYRFKDGSACYLSHDLRTARYTAPNGATLSR